MSAPVEVTEESVGGVGHVLDVLARRCTRLTVGGAVGFGVAWFGLVAMMIASFVASMSSDSSGWDAPVWVVWMTLAVGLGGLGVMLVAFVGAITGLASPRRRATRPVSVWIADLVLASPIGVLAIGGVLAVIANALPWG